jgi:hypothetical protein
MSGKMCRFGIHSAAYADRYGSRPAYIAGVTNPIFLSSRAWDLLLDIGSGAVTVSKDIHTRYPLSNLPTIPSSRSGTLKSDSSVASEDEVVRSSKESRTDGGGKIDYNADKNFIDDVRLSTAHSVVT